MCRLYSYFLFIIFFVVFLITGTPHSVSAKDMVTGPVPIDLVSVIDGDTIDVRAYIWLGQSIITRVRLNGIDTPELRAKCDSEANKAKQAKKSLEDLIIGQKLTLKNIHYGKFAGRVLADLYINDDMSVTEHLIAINVARVYHGGKRLGWC